MNLVRRLLAIHRRSEGNLFPGAIDVGFGTSRYKADDTCIRTQLVTRDDVCNVLFLSSSIALAKIITP